MKAIPALLTNDVIDLFQQIHKCSRYFSYFQIDIGDGNFVKNKTVTLANIREYLQDEHSSSIYHSCNFDFHLMVEDYMAHFEGLVTLQQYIPINAVLVHAGVNPDLATIQQNYDQFSLGLVLNPEDTVADVAKRFDIKSLPLIQIMTVTPGVQGNPFLPEMLNKIDELKALGYTGKIYLDGSVNSKTIPLICDRKNRPDVVGIGSYLSKAEDLEKRVKDLEKLLGV